ncbi:hypothetical protein ES703_59215 [subsurface metagenome]
MPIRIASGGKGKEATQATILNGTFSRPKIPDNIMAPTIMNRSIAVIFTAPSRLAFKVSQLSFRYIRAKTIAVKAPTAAASVGVVTPRYIPPSTKSMMTITGHILIMFKALRFRGIFSKGGASWGCIITLTTI